MKTKKTKNKNSCKVAKNMTFIEVINACPDAVFILMKHGMQCAGCGMAANETLEQGALMHGIDPDKLVKELNNKMCRKTKSKKGKEK